ncbi:hypothetical protein MBM_04184 [Drepanopeziza brunnea f. sp. 'multigermtubi' MB_m1]|uniref:Uncharacterized protein n=1 Tax=Marssonina brunnea f. sp. multigermtubi (strain MB_m1) TaxID=1072389 RepID=K1WJH3_MARBU|nr:uncharacterized protein MBM_04184 [Drepanopeziza brunnea f. sp. 'multigermtubi' MB_m1]EKD17815.1 hypothetical protein MBM_04184 [Drepanopeziza brunnea f. sp. 'multigermtubi' MB_m1]
MNHLISSIKGIINTHHFRYHHQQTSSSARIFIAHQLLSRLLFESSPDFEILIPRICSSSTSSSPLSRLHSSLHNTCRRLTTWKDLQSRGSMPGQSWGVWSKNCVQPGWLFLHLRLEVLGARSPLLPIAKQSDSELIIFQVEGLESGYSGLRSRASAYPGPEFWSVGLVGDACAFWNIGDGFMQCGFLPL